MPVITSTELGSTGYYIYFDQAAFDDLGSQTVLAYVRATGSGGGGFAYMYGKTPTGSINGPRFFINHNSGSPILTFGANSSTKAGFPTRAGATGSAAYNSWGHYAYTWDGSLDSTNILLYAGIGAALSDVSAADSATNDGTGAVSSDAANPAYLMNRYGLGREFVGDVAYVAVWDRVLSLAELRLAQDAGPLEVPSGLVLLWANQDDLGPNALTETGRATHVDGELPSNLNLGALPYPSAVIALTGTTATVSETTGATVECSAATIALTGTTATVSEAATVVSVECTAGVIVLSGTTATVATTIVIEDNFERSSVNTSLSSVTGAGDAAVIVLRPRVQESEVVSSQTRWMHPLAKITGVNGARPTFRFNRYRPDVDGGYHYSGWDATRRPMFSYDLETWYYFDNTTVNNTGDINTGTIEFRHDTAFTANTVYVSRGRVRTVTQCGAWIDGLESLYPTLIHSVPSNTSGFVSATYTAQTDELSRSISAQPLYAFMVSDSSLTPADGSDKGTVVLVAGVHAAEDQGNWTLEAAVEFLLSADVKAQNVRRHFNTYVYPMLNAPGRAGGGWRGSFTQGTAGIDDLNRHFSDALPSSLEIIQLPRTAMETDLPSVVHVAIDFHGQQLDDYGIYTDTGDTYQAAFDSALEAYMGAGAVGDVGESNAGFVPVWFRNTRSTRFAITSELGDPAPITDANIVTWGESHIKAISDLLDSGGIVLNVIEATPATIVLAGQTASVQETSLATTVECAAGSIVLAGQNACFDYTHGFKARPICVVSNDTWASSDTSAPLYDMVDEEDPDTAGYIHNTAATSVVNFAINAVPDPAKSTGHVLRFQAWNPGGGGWLNVYLNQGATSLAAHPLITGTLATTVLATQVESTFGLIVLSGQQATIGETVKTEVACSPGTVVCVGGDGNVTTASTVRGRHRGRYTTYIEPTAIDEPGTPPSRYGAAFGALAPVLPLPLPAAPAAPLAKKSRKSRKKPQPVTRILPKNVISFPARIEEAGEEEVIDRMLREYEAAAPVSADQERAAQYLELLAQDIRRNPSKLSQFQIIMALMPLAQKLEDDELLRLLLQQSAA